MRIVVENAISMIKKWKICSHVFRVHTTNLNQALKFHDQVWRICAALTNWTKMPIREKLNKMHFLHQIQPFQRF